MLELRVTSAAAALRVLRLVVFLLSWFVSWAICALLSADSRSPGEVLAAKIALPLMLLVYALVLIWGWRIGKPQPPPADDSWPKAPRP